MPHEIERAIVLFQMQCLATEIYMAIGQVEHTILECEQAKPELQPRPIDFEPIRVARGCFLNALKQLHGAELVPLRQLRARRKRMRQQWKRGNNTLIRQGSVEIWIAKWPPWPSQPNVDELA